MRLSQRARRTESSNFFRAETSLVSCVSSPSWIVVKVSQLLNNRIFWHFLGYPWWAPPSGITVWDTMRYFLNMLDGNLIPFECFGSEIDTFRMLLIYKRNLLRNKNYNFWVKNDLTESAYSNLRFSRKETCGDDESHT